MPKTPGTVKPEKSNISSNDQPIKITPKTSSFNNLPPTNQQSSALSSNIDKQIIPETDMNDDNNKINYIKQLNDSMKTTFTLLETSYDSSLNQITVPHSKTLNTAKSSAAIPVWHKHKYLPQFDQQELYNKLTLQTLFFIFYNYGGTKAQYFSALTLKKRDWRFHTQLNRWCRRSTEPHVLTSEYEQGPYVTFDYENWVQKSEDNLKFEFRYLEDKRL